jgi:glycosyltransferase involved in cell wall biosynthesis
MTRLTLIRTSPDFPPGSMSAYATLVAGAMSGSPDFEVRIGDFFDPSGGSSMRRHHLWRLLHANSFFEQHPSDLYHLLDGSMAAFLPSKVWKKTLVTVHDLIPLLQLHGRLAGRPGFAGRVLIHRTVRVLQNVAGIAAVSAHTARDLLELTGRSDTTVIPHPVRELPDPDETLELPDRYLFHVGNNADYKNRAGVLEVFSRLQDIRDLHLVMAGPSPTEALCRKAAALKRIRFIVDASDAELSALYKNAAAFLFPSLYEGFGMPVLEAMAAGCPVVCSSAASLPEVAGEAARMAPANTPDLLANHCRIVLEDAGQREELIRRGRRRVQQFTMEKLSDALKAWYAQRR